MIYLHAALFMLALVSPALPVADEGADAAPAAAGAPLGDQVRVAIECEDLCPRYTARLIRGVKVGPSPEWLQKRLATLGAQASSWRRARTLGARSARRTEASMAELGPRAVCGVRRRR